MKKVLFAATVVKKHIMEFHVPFLKLFKEMGWETAVAAKNDYQNPDECVIPYCDTYYNVQFERSPLRLSNIKTLRKLRKIIREGNYDIIHCHTPVGAAVTRIAAIGARKSGTKVMYTAHGFHFCKGAPLKHWLLFYPIEWALAHFTDVLVTINQEDYRFAQKHMHAKEVRYVPGVGIDTHRFRKNAELRTQIRQELGFSEEDFVILTVAELIPRKNHEVILRALHRMKDCLADKKIKYVICGDGLLQKELKKKVRQMGLQEHVVFVGYRRDVDAFCNGSDLFAFMSHQEGLPVALMEAMACGLPVICSKIRGNVDLVADGVDGFLLENTTDAVAGMILRLHAEPETREKIGNAAIQKIQNFESQKICEEMKRIYYSE